MKKDKNTKMKNGPGQPLVESSVVIENNSEVNASTEAPSELHQVTSRMSLHSGLYDHGRQRAIQSMALKPDEAEMRSLEEHARAMARETHRDAFNPGKHAHDKLRDDEFKKLISDRAETERAEQWAVTEVREREQAVAKVQPAPQPETPFPIIMAGTAVLALTMAPTLHDFVFATLEDDLLAWFFAVGSGGCVGFFVAWCLLGDFDATGARSAANWGGLVAGIVVALALGILRLSATKCPGEVIFALALTLLEIGAVLFLEWRAADLRPAYKDWATSNRAHEEAVRQLESAQKEHARLTERLEKLNAGIQEHSRYVEDRGIRHLTVEELETVAVKAVLDGYRAGLAENNHQVLKGGSR